MAKKTKINHGRYVYIGGFKGEFLWVLDGLGGLTKKSLADLLFDLRVPGDSASVSFAMRVISVVEHGGVSFSSPSSIPAFLAQFFGCPVIGLIDDHTPLYISTPPKVKFANRGFSQILVCDLRVRALTAQERVRYDIELIAHNGDYQWLSASWLAGGPGNLSRQPSKGEPSTSPSPDP